MLVKLILIALLIFVIYLVIKFFRFLNKINLIFKTTKESYTQSKKSNLMVKDEVCNTYLPQEDAIEINIGGEKHYFCSQECKQKFLEEHKKGFLKKS